MRKLCLFFILIVLAVNLYCQDKISDVRALLEASRRGTPSVRNVLGFYSSAQNAIYVNTTMTEERIASTIVHEFVHFTQQGRTGNSSELLKYWYEHEAFTVQAMFDFDAGIPFQDSSFAGTGGDIINYNAIESYVDRVYGGFDRSPHFNDTYSFDNPRDIDL